MLVHHNFLLKLVSLKFFFNSKVTLLHRRLLPDLVVDNNRTEILEKTH